MEWSTYTPTRSCWTNPYGGGWGKSPWEPIAIPITNSFHLPLQAGYCEKAGTALKARPTSGDAKHPHDTDDGRVDGQ